MAIELMSMEVSPLADHAQRLAAFIAGARRLVAFTGAGISTECGIPDFRSRDSHPEKFSWRRTPPMPFADFLASEDNRKEAWRRKFAMDDLLGAVQPGRGHFALVRLAARGKLAGIITQNIDGLHRAAGTPDDCIVELHGNGTYAVCLTCDARQDLASIRARFERDRHAPVCACGGLVKTATISFGQTMPAGPMKRARELALACDALIAIGSTLVVYPAAGFPLLAKENGARLAILNRDPTPLDSHADLVLRDDIGDVLARTVN